MHGLRFPSAQWETLILTFSLGEKELPNSKGTITCVRLPLPEGEGWG
jgi:hypothetical protein